MRFHQVRIESLAHVLPDERVPSQVLEAELAPLYERLGLVVGRLELMTGIAERRFWPEGTRPSDAAAKAGRVALERSGVGVDQLGIIVHAAVCRDFMEPATASVVHHRLGLPAQCTALDLSNACIGFVNAMAMVAGLIESGQIKAGLIVAGEDGGPLVRETIAMLNRDQGMDRARLKLATASLTIGSGAAAMVLAHESVATSEHSLLGGTARAATEHYELCAGDATSGSGPLMETDSDALLHAGCALAKDTFGVFLDELGWDRDSVNRLVTHQVTTTHKRVLLETLELDESKDFATVRDWGNVGSVSLPGSLSLAADQGLLAPGENICLQGIGSGLHCQMLGLRW